MKVKRIKRRVKVLESAVRALQQEVGRLKDDPRLADVEGERKAYTTNEGNIGKNWDGTPIQPSHRLNFTEGTVTPTAEPEPDEAHVDRFGRGDVPHV